MNRNTLLEMSGRVMHQAMRFTLNAHNDSPMMQEVHLDGFNSDGRNNVERVQNYGFTSSPLPRDQQQGGDSGGGGGGGGGGGDIGAIASMLGQAAEGICMFMGGQRNHPVCIGVDDRRHRPMQMKPGENAQYDDIGQMTLLRRIGTFILSLDDDQQGASAGQHDGSSGSGQQSQTRMVSMRHVNKKKQQRPGSQSGSGGGTGGSPSSGSQQDYKHEGDSVNTEVRVTKSRISFFAGSTEVGYYDTGAKTWCFIGKVKLGTDSAADPVYGSHKGVGNITDAKGQDAVFVNAPKPGPPTALDTQP